VLRDEAAVTNKAMLVVLTQGAVQTRAFAGRNPRYGSGTAFAGKVSRWERSVLPQFPFAFPD
jgi:hypothetical protein